HVEPPDSAYICYASKPNSLMIRPDGAVGKCTVALKDARNNLGRINPDGTLEIDQAKVKPWIRGFVSLNEVELACPYVGLVPGRLPIIESPAGGREQPLATR
ncbi:MAG: hypothetical protein LC808_41230, partial [Actinobacteria bacterium]|nr:hypothetical protein [Actinomycetota bacterium]